jgi:hypothetical protein
VNRHTDKDEEAAVYMDENEDVYVNGNQEQEPSYEMISVH